MTNKVRGTPRSGEKRRHWSRARLALPCFAAALSATGAFAADLPATTAPAPFVAPAPGFDGPLASFAAPLAAKGITFHAVILDFSAYNPSLGLVTDRGANSGYIIEGVDVDLGLLAGLQGTSLHFENMFFAGVFNTSIAPQIGDSQVGFEPPFTPRPARLSRATIEQTFLDGKLDVEAGVTHPGYYYAKFNCSSLNTCFNSILYLNAGYPSFAFGIPGVNVAYQATPTIYAQAGAFAVQTNTNFHVGYDFPDEQYIGALAMAEVGSKTSFATDPYPYKIALTGFVNTSDHADLNATSAVTGVSRTKAGTSGVVVTGEKIVWRQDAGAEAGDKTPTAIKIFGSFAASTESTSAIAADMWVGATLLSPFAGRPADTYGVKVNYERLNTNFAQYLTAANVVSGGAGSPYNPDHFVFEVNSHIQLPLGMAFEPVFQYEVHPDSYFNPLTPVKARDGVFFSGTFIVPLGVLLGAQAPS